MFEVIVRVVAVLAIVGFAVLAYRYDKVRGRQEIQRFVLEGHMQRALRNRRHIVQIPAVVLKAAFQLSTRALPDPKQWNSKPGRHPALEEKVRREP